MERIYFDVLRLQPNKEQQRYQSRADYDAVRRTPKVVSARRWERGCCLWRSVEDDSRQWFRYSTVATHRQWPGFRSRTGARHAFLCKRQNLGLVSFRYLWPTGPKEALAGRMVTVTLTFAHLAKAITS